MFKEESSEVITFLSEEKATGINSMRQLSWEVGKTHLYFLSPMEATNLAIPGSCLMELLALSCFPLRKVCPASEVCRMAVPSSPTLRQRTEASRDVRFHPPKGFCSLCQKPLAKRTEAFRDTISRPCRSLFSMPKAFCKEIRGLKEHEIMPLKASVLFAKEEHEIFGTENKGLQGVWNIPVGRGRPGVLRSTRAPRVFPTLRYPMCT